MGVASRDGTILRVNPGFERVLGLAPEEIVGRRLVEIVHPDDREATATVFAGVLESGELSVFENRLPAADGSHRWLEWNVLAVAAGLVVGMLFEGWLDSILLSARARLAETARVASTTVLLYVGLRAYAHAVGWTHAEPEEWIAYAGLNAIGAGVILHVAIGHRWPFASPEESAAMT